MLGLGRFGVDRRNARGAALAVVLALGLAAAGCSSTDLFGPSRSASSPPPAASPPAGSTSFSDRMNAFFFGPPARPGDPAAALVQVDADCPGVDIRSGASTLSLGAAGAEPSATSLRYQVSIVRMARECALLGATMTMKVGVQGRVILGPAGGPGQVDVPIRLALVQEGVEPKTIWTKFYRVAVAVPPGQTNVPFVHIEEDVTFPLPRPAELEAYVVYVGFDPAALVAPPPDRRKSTKKAR